MSSKIKGTVTWKMGSLDVKAEGKSVVRFMDPAFHNGNTFNTAFQNMGGTGLAYADDFKGYCEICNQGPEDHRVLETPNSADICARLIQDLRTRFNNASDANKGNKGNYARRRGNRFNGYMVGVMVCPCGRIFAAMSGQDLPGFAESVQAVGAVLVGGGPATAAQLAGANTSSRETAARKQAVISQRFDQLGALNNARTSGYNPPGNCAGAKLMARSGHKPVQMTEAFSIVRDTPFVYRVFRTSGQVADAWLRTVLANRAAPGNARWAPRAYDLQPEEFEGDVSIPSCHTCQQLLYLTMCPERRCG
jgi:hypothetical protein